MILGQAVEQRELKIQALQREVEKLRMELEDALLQAVHEEPDHFSERGSVEVVLENGSPSTENSASQYQSQSVEGGLDTVGESVGLSCVHACVYVNVADTLCVCVCVCMRV